MAFPEVAGGEDRTKQTQAEPCAEPRARSWRPQFDLGRASPGLPVNAGLEAHQAACRTWRGSMRNRKYNSGQTRAQWSLSTSLRLLNDPPPAPSLNIHRIPAHGLAQRISIIHHRRYFLSSPSLFQNFNLISLFLFYFFVYPTVEGSL